MTRLSRGDTSIARGKAQTAENWGSKLVERKQVLDLDPMGKPYVRKARPDELDQEGNLIAYNSRFPGLTDAQWAALGSPEMRRVAADRFITDFQGPVPGASAARPALAPL